MSSALSSDRQIASKRLSRNHYNSTSWLLSLVSTFQFFFLLASSPTLSNPSTFGVMSADGTCDFDVCTQWIATVFNSCVCTPLQHAGFWIGIVSIPFSLLTPFPQVITNFRRKSTEGFSFYLLLFWTFGDSCDFIGTLLLGESPHQILTAIGFLLFDTIMLLQWLIYTKLRPMWHRDSSAGLSHSFHSTADTHRLLSFALPSPPTPPTAPFSHFESIPLPDLFHHGENMIPYEAGPPGGGGPGSAPFLPSFHARPLGLPSPLPTDPPSAPDSERGASSSIRTSAGDFAPSQGHDPQGSHRNRTESLSKLAFVQAVSLSIFCMLAISRYAGEVTSRNSGTFTGRWSSGFELFGFIPYSSRHIIGQILGYITTACYVFGPLCQFVLNIRRHSVEGLNPLVFIFPIIGGGLYIIGTAMELASSAALVNALSFFLSFFLPNVLNVIILCQFVYYVCVAHRESEDNESDPEFAVIPSVRGGLEMDADSTASRPGIGGTAKVTTKPSVGPADLTESRAELGTAERDGDRDDVVISNEAVSPIEDTGGCLV